MNQLIGTGFPSEGSWRKEGGIGRQQGGEVAGMDREGSASGVPPGAPFLALPPLPRTFAPQFQTCDRVLVPAGWGFAPPPWVLASTPQQRQSVG